MQHPTIIRWDMRVEKVCNTINLTCKISIKSFPLVVSDSPVVTSSITFLHVSFALRPLQQYPALYITSVDIVRRSIIPVTVPAKTPADEIFLPKNDE